MGGALDPGVRFVFEALFNTRSSIVSGTASLISLESINPSVQRDVTRIDERKKHQPKKRSGAKPRC